VYIFEISYKQSDPSLLMPCFELYFVIIADTDIDFSTMHALYECTETVSVF